MTSLSRGELIALYICPMVSGTLSLVSSSIITLMILFSKDKLSYPFRRLIFGLSIADMIQSVAMITGPFAIPKSEKGALWAEGNVLTCDLQGFALHTGFAGVPMYVLSLTVYYLCAVRYNMKDRVFSKKVEPFLHAVSIAWTLGGGIACWAFGVFNMMASGNVCWYTPSPHDCVSNDAVACARGKLAFTFGWLFGGSNAITLCGIIYCLHGVIKTVRDQEIKNKAYGFGEFHRRIANENAHPHRHNMLRRVSMSMMSLSSDSAYARNASGNENENENENEQPNRKRQRRRRSSTGDDSHHRFVTKTRQLKRETMVQSSLYVISFLASCAWAYLYGFLVTVGLNVPFPISLLFSLFYPLGGVFNILVYTRPKIRSLRRKHKSMPWLRAFFEVLRAGVEVPQIIIRRSASDLSDPSFLRGLTSSYYRNSSRPSEDYQYRSKSHAESIERANNFPSKFSEEDEGEDADADVSTNSANPSSFELDNQEEKMVEILSAMIQKTNGVPNGSILNDVARNEDLETGNSPNIHDG